MKNSKFENIVIEEEYNPYRECIQGLSNEPICVLHVLNKAWNAVQVVDTSFEVDDMTLEEIVKRLVTNKPRIAVITGSPDHPAHLMDDLHINLAVLRIWQNGGVPFVFGIPVICDGTAQSNIGQSYSLVSRNHTASAVNITFEGHSYHAAYVLSSCDKYPAAVMSGLAAADVARSHPDRQQAPVWAVFVPEHVLKGGCISDESELALKVLIDKAKSTGNEDLASDIEENMRYILQCSSGEAFAGQLKRAELLGLIDEDESRNILNNLAASTCDVKGGVCAFNGTGNSSRTLVSALGLVPSISELLTGGPSPKIVAECVDTLFKCLNKPELRITNILGTNFANAVRVHNTTGSSSNILLHLPAVMRYAGFDISIADYEKVRKETPVPEIFAHSLTENRDTYVMAQQFEKNQHKGMASIYKILVNLDIKMDLDAPTVEGLSWGERIKQIDNPVDVKLGDKSIIRTAPVRETSGVEVLRGNFMSSSIVKVAGMSDDHLEHFKDQLFTVRYYENEHLCIKEIASPDLANILEKSVNSLSRERLEHLLAYNSKGKVTSYDKNILFDLVRSGALAFAFVIAGQGPRAFGMPEMFTPSQNLKHHQLLESSSLLITDGRYSGVTKGACIGHVTPEAFEGGGIGMLEDGDVLWLRIGEKKMDVLDGDALSNGKIEIIKEFGNEYRKNILDKRMEQMVYRQGQVAASNLMDDVTSAEKGCVPRAVDRRATKELPNV